MDAEEKDIVPVERPSSFDLLFERDLIHVLDMIFFPLDNPSFKNCLEVSKKWRGFLTSDEFQRRMSRSAFSQRLWMDTANLKHQLWYTDGAVPRWTTNGDEVAFIDGKTLKYITNEGQVKEVSLPLAHDGIIDGMWILKETILVLCLEDDPDDNAAYFINKKTLNISKFCLPRCSSQVQWDCIDYYFVPQRGLVLRILVENCSMWLGKISIEHRQESDWQGNYEQDSYLFDEDRCSYFAKVDSFFPNGNHEPWEYSVDANYSFSEDGSHLIIVGIEENGYICLIALDGENTGLVWRKESNDNEFALANSRFVFLVHRRGCLTIKDIKDGSDVKEIELGFDSELLPWFTEDPDEFIFLSGKFIIVREPELERELLMVDLDTFETRGQPLNCFERDLNVSEPEAFPIVLFHGRKLAVYTNTFITEGVNVNCYHFDLTARNLDELCDGHGELTSEVKCYGPHESVDAYAREVCRGVYLLIISEDEIRAKNRGRSTSRTFYEVVSWKSEELPLAMRRFFSLVGIKEGGDSSPHPSEADPSEINLPDP